MELAAGEIVVLVMGVVAMIGGFIVRDRSMAKQITDGDDKLHERINRVRDEYVRRDDLDTHLAPLIRSHERIEKALDGHTKRLDAALAALGRKSD